MKKKMIAAILAAAMTMAMGVTAFAGQWEQTGADWKYSDNGGYLTGWQWIDGKCYYFYPDGIMAKDTVVDGYTVNGDGQWTVNGSIQMKTEAFPEYCKNIAVYGENTVAFSLNVTDQGDYYDSEMEIYSEFPEGGTGVPEEVSHVRIRKSAVVHWEGYSNTTGSWEAWDMSLDEYANLFNRDGVRKPLTSIRMFSVVQDEDGYVTEFFDSFVS